MTTQIKTQDIQAIITNFNSKVTQYLDVKELITENDYLEVLGDSVSFIRGISSAYRLVSQKRLAHFLKGLTIDNAPTEEQLIKMTEYINSEEKAEFISDNIAKVLMSNSKKSALILGVLVNRLINSKLDLTHRELVCANALMSFFDFDIDNILVIEQYFNFMIEKRPSKSKSFNFYRQFKDWATANNISTGNGFFLTVEKCVTTQILSVEYDVELDIDEDDVSNTTAEQTTEYRFSSAGELLLENLKLIEKTA